MRQLAAKAQLDSRKEICEAPSRFLRFWVLGLAALVRRRHDDAPRRKGAVGGEGRHHRHSDG